MSRINLEHEWSIGDKIDGGGMGQVYTASSDLDSDAVAKLVPKKPGAGRELLFAELPISPNIVPIIDRGETENDYVLVMPRAEKSLRRYLEEAGGPIPVVDALPILSDITQGLISLEGSVVHRDLKPENVLLLNGRWCLADFGISRYAEATTALDTHKYAMTPPYASPEQWKAERATSATDIYALGIIAYELVAGNRPFSGPDYRSQHLHDNAPSLDSIHPLMAALIDECLFKAPQARPMALNVLNRLAIIGKAASSSGGLAKLQQANLAEVGRLGAGEREAAMAQTEEERRHQLAMAAARSLERISDMLKEAILANASAASIAQPGTGNPGWNITLNGSKLQFTAQRAFKNKPWARGSGPVFDVISYAQVEVTAHQPRNGYTGRSHSMWYCDAKQADQYGWYETAFMDSPLIGGQGRSSEPFALAPDTSAGSALGPGMTTMQAAWPFTLLEIDALDDFIDRWAGWLAAASTGTLYHPMQMPDRSPHGSWRTS